jgi:CRP/FNR family cyclic AMP-dependent transcriptional regulator
MLKVNPEEFIYLPIFNNVHNTTLDLLKLKAYKLRLDKGEILFAEKDKVNTIYIVLKGKVTLFRNSEGGQKRVIYILSEGEFINEVIFDDLPASINCEAFENSYILCFGREELLEIMSRDFKFTQTIINSMGKKIRRLYRQLKNTVPIKMDKKLAAKLWKLSKDYGVETADGTMIDLNISVTYLADMLGSTRETVSRCINNFEKQGLIKFQGKRIIVKDKKQLSVYFRGV